MNSEPADPKQSRDRECSGTAPDYDGMGALVVGFARDIWRLRAAIQRSRDRGEVVAEAVLAIVERLQEDLDVGGIELLDPTGQLHYPGANYDLAYIEGEGEGELVVAETVSPGVKVGGRLLAKPTVVLRRGGKP